MPDLTDWIWLQQERGRIRASGVVMLLRLLTTERSPVPWLLEWCD